MSPDGGRPSWWITALSALFGGLFALVGGSAVNTAPVPVSWRPLIWLLTAVLLAGVVLLAVLQSGGAVGLGGITRRPAVRLVGAALAGFVFAVLVIPTPSQPKPTPTDPPSTPTTTPASPSSSPTTPQPTPSPTTPQPTLSPTTPSAAPVARVRWHGRLTMDCCGGPGYSLDSVPPSGAVVGDVQGAAYNRITGEALVEWEATAPPAKADCANRLNTVVGQHDVEVSVGTVVCFGTRAGRVGYLTVVALSRPGALDSLTTTVEATVWDRP